MSGVLRRAGLAAGCVLAISACKREPVRTTEPSASATSEASASTVDDEKAAFAARVLARFEKEGITGFRYDAEQFGLVADKPGGGAVPGRVNLQNFFDQDRAGQKEPSLDRLIGAMRGKPDTPQTFKEAGPRLGPYLRDRFFFARLMESQTEQRGADGPVLRIPADPIGDAWAVGVALDSPDSMRSVTQQDLADWNVSFAEARTVALANLRSVSARPLVQDPAGYCVSAWKDDYDAARALLPEVIATCEVRGQPVMAVPNTNTLLVAGSEDEAALARMLDRVEELTNGPRPLSRWPMLQTPTGFAPFMPARGPLRARVRLLQLNDLLSAYVAQQETLTQRFATEKKDLFVAELVVAEPKPDSSDVRLPASVCAWTEGVPSLLPRSDLIAFVRVKDGKGKTIGFGSFDKILATGKLKPLGMQPERYQTYGFPGEDELKANTSPTLEELLPR